MPRVERSSRTFYPYNQGGSPFIFTSDVNSDYSPCVPPRHRKHFEHTSPEPDCPSCLSCSSCCTSSVSLPSFAQLVADLPRYCSPTFPQIPSTSLEFCNVQPSLYYQTGLVVPTCSQCHNVSPPESRLVDDTSACPSPVTIEPELLIPRTVRLASMEISTPHAGTSRIPAKRRRSPDVSELWMENVVNLGPNDNGVVTWQCLNQYPDGRVCGYEARRSTVKRHCLGVHLRLRPHVCTYEREGPNGKPEQCNQGFSQASSLKVHVQTVHTGKEPHKCPVPGCDAKFSDPARRSHHIRNHSPADRETYMCKRTKAPFANSRKRSDTTKAFPASRRASKKR